MYLSKPIILLSVALLMAFTRLDYVHNAGNTSEDSTLLVIGVLSAQNNSAARYSIRHTWKSFVKTNMKFYFLIGQDFCPFHPIDRKSELTCDFLELIPPSGKPYLEPMWTPNVLENHNKDARLWITSFTFRVNYPMILRGIQVWKGAVPMSIPTAVRFKNARTGKVLKTGPVPAVTDLSGDDREWFNIQLEPFLMQKSFDAEVEFLAMADDATPVRGPNPCYGLSSWFNFSGGIEFTSLYGPDMGWIPFDDDSCTPISLRLELNDIQTYLEDRETRSKLWKAQIVSLSESLKNEAFIEKDILFLNVLDVYSNISKKLIEFYKWIQINLSFSFVLKSDDDTMINVPVIERFLQSVMDSNYEQNKNHMWWWGKLRHGLPVERHGKWQELQFAAPVYPPFPCGSGYILNKNIIKFLVNTSDWLHSFQGEDTSLGIWLSGIHPNSPKNAVCHWTCGDECGSHSCNRGQLSVENMVSVWEHYQKTDILC